MHVVRSHKFNINMEFADEFVDSLSSEYAVGGDRRGTPIARISQAAGSIIRPNEYGSNIDTKPYEDMCPFILMWDNPVVEASSRLGSSRKHDMRLIYLGYIMSPDPVVHRYGNTIIDHDAPVFITHVTSTRIAITTGYQGTMLSPRMITDSDIINPRSLLTISPDRQYDLSPNILLRNDYSSGDGSTVTAYSLSQIDTGAPTLDFARANRNPKEQIRSLYKGLRKYASTTLSPSMRHTGAHDRYYSDSYYTPGSRFQVSQHMSTTNPDIPVGFSVNSIHRLEDIVRACPELKNRDSIQFIDVPFDLQHEVLDNRSPSVTNIWTAMLESALPPILASRGITDISFRYCSNPAGSSIRLDPEPAVQLQDIGFSILDLSKTEQIATWRECLGEIEREVFEVLITTAGDFDLIVDYHSANYTRVRLQFLDDETLPDNTYSVTHGTFNPLTTPLIGDQHTLIHNSDQFGELVDQATEWVNSRQTDSYR